MLCPNMGRFFSLLADNDKKDNAEKEESTTPFEPADPFDHLVHMMNTQGRSAFPIDQGTVDDECPAQPTESCFEFKVDKNITFVNVPARQGFSNCADLMSFCSGIN